MEWEVKWWDWMPWSSFFECWVLSPGFFHSPLSPPSRGSLIPLCFLQGQGAACKKNNLQGFQKAPGLWFGRTPYAVFLWLSCGSCCLAVEQSPSLSPRSSAFRNPSILYLSHHHPFQFSPFFPFYLPPLNSAVTRMWDENITFVYWIKNNACNILTFKNYFPKTPSVI